VKVTSKRKFEDRREETNLEDKALLSPVRKWKFYITIQTSWAQQCRVKCICSVGGHYHLHIDCLIKTIHLTPDTLNIIMQPKKKSVESNQAPLLRQILDWTLLLECM
jgi:hypothetical protein